MQDRPEGCILCNSPVSKIREVCQIPVERHSIRVLLPLLRAFSSSSGFYKVNKSLYLSLEKAQYKNNNLPRGHAPNGIFIRGLVDGKRYTDIHTSTLRVSDQYQKVLPRANIDFRISWGNSRFWGNDFEHFQGETSQSTESLSGNPRKRESNRELRKLTGRLSSTAIAVPPAPIHYRHLQHQQIQKLICHNSFEEKVTISLEARKELLWWKENLTLCNGRSLISPPPQIISSNALL